MPPGAAWGGFVTSGIKKAVWTGRYPPKAQACTVHVKAVFESPDGVAPPSSIDIPPVFLRFGQAVQFSVDNDGAMVVTIFDPL